jgi:hypothetical protein
MKKTAILLLILSSCGKNAVKGQNKDERSIIVQTCIDSLYKKALAAKEPIGSVTLEETKYLPSKKNLKWGDLSISIKPVPANLKKITSCQDWPKKHAYIISLYNISHDARHAHVAVGVITGGSEALFSLSYTNQRWDIDAVSVVDTVEDIPICIIK